LQSSCVATAGPTVASLLVPAVCIRQSKVQDVCASVWRCWALIQLWRGVSVAGVCPPLQSCTWPSPNPSDVAKCLFHVHFCGYEEGFFHIWLWRHERYLSYAQICRLMYLCYAQLCWRRDVLFVYAQLCRDRVELVPCSILRGVVECVHFSQLISARLRRLLTNESDE
jgi:hypothetical protein